MAADSGRGEGDLEIGLASRGPGSGGDVSPRRLDQSPSPAVKSPGLLMYSSGNRLDQVAGRNKYVKQVIGLYNQQGGDLDAVCQIMPEIGVQMTGTGEEFDSEVAEIRAAMVNETNSLETLLFMAAERGHTDIVVKLLKHSDKEILVRKNRLGFNALHVAAKEGHRGQQ